VALLESLAGSQGREAAVDLLDAQYATLTRRLTAELTDAPPTERLAAVTHALSEAGYMAEWNEAAGAFQLAERNCAIRAVAERFPEVCAAEARFLETVLGAAVERRQHIVGGCNACEYAITFGPTLRHPERS
jgi:DeoR family suf operon transcriptional repressor